MLEEAVYEPSHNKHGTTGSGRKSQYTEPVAQRLGFATGSATLMSNFNPMKIEARRSRGAAAQRPNQ